MKDEELQNKIEAGMLVHSDDGEAYRHVFTALKQEPAFHVSLPFADRILAKIEKREEQRDFRWLALGIFLSVIALIVALVITNAWTIGVFSFISGYPGLVVFGIVFVLFLHWMDKKLVRRDAMH